MTQQYSITGVVVDTNNTPLEGVSVKIYRWFDRQIEQIGSGRTAANGQYVSDFDTGTPVIVRYDHMPGGLDNCHPTLLSHLSGASHHTVNVVMYQAGQHYERDSLLDILSAYERVYLLDVSLNMLVAEIRSTYQSGLGMMKWVDEITECRYKEVRALYEQGT